MKTLFACVVGYALLFWASNAGAQVSPPCKPYTPEVFNEFLEDFGESRAFSGTIGSGQIYLLVNPTTGTFSLVVISEDGSSVCLATDGKDAMLHLPLIPGEKI